MEERGGSVGFFLCKVGVAFAAVAFVGFALSMYAGSTRFAEGRDLEAVAMTIARTIEEVDDFPREAELRRELPASSQQFEVLITGELKGGLQMVQVRVISELDVECSLIVSTLVNGGDFRISMKNPHEIMVEKSGTIVVELV